ncbi:TIGR00366 family protein [Paraburkholderia sediminicola]|uniref:TIGR00366 family protein n=1 Tax=Paraburkholderia rhynchosiae TaxID=487049 RepID=A0ACC7NME6_9BURK
MNESEQYVHSQPAQDRATAGQPALSRVSMFFVRLFERYMPDSFSIALLLTFVTALLAFFYAPKSAPKIILEGWYKGMFDIASYAFLVALMLVTGYALAVAKPVARLLKKLASLPKTPAAVAAVTVLTIAVCAILHWAFALIATGLFAREIAKRSKEDYAWIVAACFSGFALFTQGLSCSVELISATKGNPLNIVEKVTGHVIPLSEIELASYNVIPVIVLMIVLPLLFIAMRPRGANIIPADSERLIAEDTSAAAIEQTEEDVSNTISAKLSRAWWINALVVIGGVTHFILSGLTFDLMSMIIGFMLAGMALHGRPDAYAAAISKGARLTGSLLLQFPFYGGIMGIMTTTGLATVLAEWFGSFSTTTTLPFWSLISSTLISLFVPSAGGHWAVQGPFIIPVAHALHASIPATLIGVASGEGAADMIQPMWMLPILAITGVSIRRVMGFTIMSFFVMMIVWSLDLLFLVPAG